MAKFPRVWGAHNLVEAFPNAFMGVLLPSDCFDRLPKLGRGKKFEWLYDECRERKTLESVSLRATRKRGQISIPVCKPPTS